VKKRRFQRLRWQGRTLFEAFKVNCIVDEVQSVRRHTPRQACGLARFVDRDPAAYLRMKHRGFDLEESAVAGKPRWYIGKTRQRGQARRQMLCVNYVGLFDDLGNS